MLGKLVQILGGVALDAARIANNHQAAGGQVRRGKSAKKCTPCEAMKRVERARAFGQQK